MRSRIDGGPEDADNDNRTPGSRSSEPDPYSPVAHSASGSPNRFEINLFELGHLLIRRRKWILSVVIPVVFLTALKMFTTPNLYRSGAIILPSGTADEISALGEFVGINQGIGRMGENSSVLYPLILQSNLIKDSVLSQVYNIKSKGKPIRVVPSEYFDEDDPNKLRKCLADATMVTSKKRTREIYISIETEYPELSQAMLSEYLRQLENYNRFTRKSLAKETQRYLEKRLVGAGKALEQVEEELTEFREANSNWATSTDAEILRDLLRLERNLEIRSAVYLFLEEKLETAKFDAQKDVPIVRVLDHPSLPTIKSGPNRIITIFFAGVTAFAIMVVGIIFSDLWRQGTGGNNRESYQTLSRDFSEAFPRSRRALNLIRRVRRERFLHSKDKVEV